MMPIVLGAALLVATVTPAAAQKKAEPPAAVATAFKAKFPGKTATWEKEMSGEWEAEWMEGGKQVEAEFSADGKWLHTEHDIKIAELPKAVSDAVAKEFKGYKVTEADHVEGADGKEYYEVEIKGAKDEMELVYDKSGKLISKEASKNNDKE